MPDPQPGSPRALLEKCYAALLSRRSGLDRLERYDEGKHPMAFATPKFRATFGNLFKAFSDNWCPLVLDAAAERLAIQGFRSLGADQDDREALDVWNRNYLDADHGLAIREAIKLGESYAIVAPPERGSDVPRITVEHPTQVYVLASSADRRRRVAAIKSWIDESGVLMATLYTPKALYRFQSKGTVSEEGASRVRWVERQGVPHKVTHRFGVVPVIPLQNDPSMRRGGRSDLDVVIPVQDAINKLVADMMVASEFAAFRQRWATGLEVPVDDDGKPLDEERFLSFVGRVWTVEDPEARFGEFGISDLGNYVGAIGMLIQHLSAQSRTPPHYLVGSIVNASGDALKAAETGLVSKVERKKISLGPGWGEALSLALGRPSTERLVPIWKGSESRSVGEVVDAAMKMQKLGVPDEACWEFIGASPSQIRHWKTSRESALLMEQALLLGGSRPGDRDGDAGQNAEDSGRPLATAVIGGEDDAA